MMHDSWTMLGNLQWRLSCMIFLQCSKVLHSFWPGHEHVFCWWRFDRCKDFWFFCFAVPWFFLKKRILGMFWGPGKSKVLGKILAMFGFDPRNVKSFPFFCLWVWVLDPFCLESKKKKGRSGHLFLAHSYWSSIKKPAPWVLGWAHSKPSDHVWLCKISQEKNAFFFLEKHALNDFLAVLFYWFFLFFQTKP